MNKKLLTTHYPLPTKYGFTLIELIIVIGIFSIFIGIGDSVYNNFKVRNNLEVATNSFVQALRHAQINSEQVKGDSVWGTAIFSDKVVVFKGSNYNSRDTSFDQIFNFPSGVNVSGLSEVVFEKVTGKTFNTGDVNISSDYEERKLTINSYGSINYGDLIQNIENSIIPTISTPTSIIITNTTAVLGAEVVSLGLPDSIIERGICWGTSPSPTTNCTAEGNTTIGVFNQNITGLTAGITYYYRGYAINSTGVGYSLDGIFTTFSYPIPMTRWNFNEGSGCIANDLYGGNNGSLQNNCPVDSPLWVVGKIGNALNFNGISNNVSVSSSANLNFTTSMSVSAWIKWNIVPSTGMVYATIVNKNGDSQYRLQHNSTNSKFEFGIKTNTGSTYVTSITTPVIDVWYHLVGTWDGNLIKIYVNGVLEQTGTRGGVIPNYVVDFKIGSSSLNARWFNGIIDEVNLWDRSLSQQEVTEVYSSTL